MKKIVFILALLFPIFSFAYFDKDLMYNSKGPEVIELQEFLIDQGCLSVEATGNFYSLTLKAVKCFQSANGIIPISGYFGPKTRSKANEILILTVGSIEETATAEGGISMATTTPNIESIILSNKLETLKQQQALQAELLQQQIINQQNQIQSQNLTNQQLQNTLNQTNTNLQQIINNTTIQIPTPKPDPVIIKPQLSAISFGFYNQPGSDVIINRLEFTSDQDILCYNGNQTNGKIQNTITKHCVIEGDNAGIKIATHLKSCNTRLDKGFYIFSDNQQRIDTNKIYICDITVENTEKITGDYKYEFTIPNQ